MAGNRRLVPVHPPLFFLLLFLLLLPDILSAQWDSFENPLPSGNSYYAISFLDSARGWAVGETGAIVRTTDGGAHWWFAESSTDTNLYAIHILDGSHGWAAGDNSILTLGQTGSWRVQTQMIPAGLRAVRFVDASHGWACGDSLLFSTSDGGTSWSTSRLPGAFGLKSLAVADPQHLWVAGNRCLYRSSDGGKSWSSFAPDSLFQRVDFQKVVFTSTASGWLIGTEHFRAGPNAVRFAGLMLKTADSGATWSVTLSDTLEFDFFYPQYYFFDLVFADSISGYYASRHGAFATKDGGTTWDTADAGTGFHYAMPSPRTLFAAGDLGHLSRSDDRGKTWHELSRGTRGTVRSLQTFDFASRTLAGVSLDDFNGSLLLRSDNGGYRWDTLSTFKEIGQINLTSLSFVDSLHGWCSAIRYYSGSFTRNAGVILKTTDGGRSWKQQLDDSSYNQLLAVHFVDIRHGVAAGLGLILYTMNGGETWLTRYQDPFGEPDFRAAFLKDSSTIWCGGLDRVFSSTDAGLSWKKRDTLAGLPYYSINAILFSGSQGWMAGALYGFGGADGFILASTDGGQSWANVLQASRKPFNAISFWSGAAAKVPTLMAVGDGGAFAVSNAGWSWHLSDLPHVRTNLHALAAIDDFRFMAGGDYGTILNGTLLGPDGVAVQESKPGEFRLEQNYPNPFNPSTAITFTLTRQTRVRLVVYDLLGREVATLVDEVQFPGPHRVPWSPRGLSSGVYFYRLTAGQASRVLKMLYLR